jgi:sulfatase modifying factor 1
LLALCAPSCEIVAGLSGSRDGPLADGTPGNRSAATAGSVAASAGLTTQAGGGPSGGHGGMPTSAGRGTGGATVSPAAGRGGTVGGDANGGEAGGGEGGASAGEAGAGGAGTGGSGRGGAGHAGAGARGGAGHGGGGQSAGGAGGLPTLGIGGCPALPVTSCGAEPACTEDSACTTLPVSGGPFMMGRGDAGASDAYEGDASEQPEHAVTLSPFWLDKYEVTVARFRAFVESYDGAPLAPGTGNHPRIPASGWQPEWDDQLPADRDALAALMLAPDTHCNSSYRTWTKSAGNSECLPINCVDWYVSFAFCVWDGGRLPTEAEWEFAAAGGELNYLYPWGSEAPDASRAIFGCGQACAPGNIRPIGSTTSAGYGRYGQADLAGSMLERVRDVMDPNYYRLGNAAGADVLDLALDTNLVDGVARGGNYLGDPANLRAARREVVYRSSRWDGVGIRCARNP